MQGSSDGKFSLIRWKDQKLRKASISPLRSWTQKMFNKTLCRAISPNQCSFSVSTLDIKHNAATMYRNLLGEFNCEPTLVLNAAK